MKRSNVISAASTATSAQLVKSHDMGELSCSSETMNKPRQQVNGFTLTKDAINTEGLNIREKMVLIVISDCADNRGIAYPSLEYIASRACIAYKRDRIGVIINGLEAKGLLERKGFHGRNRQYRVIGHVPTAGTNHEETLVPMSGTCMCTHTGYTNIPNNIQAPSSNPSEQDQTQQSETKGSKKQNRRNRHRRNARREKMVARSNRLDQNISNYTSFGNRLPPGPEADGIKNLVLKFKEEKAQIQKQRMSMEG